MIRKHLHVIEREGITEALLRERQIHAYRIEIHVAELRRLFVKTFGLGVAYRRIEGRQHAEDPGLTRRIGQMNGFQGIADYGKIRRDVAGFELGPHERQRISAHRCCPCALHIESPPYDETEVPYSSNPAKSSTVLTGALHTKFRHT